MAGVFRRFDEATSLRAQILYVLLVLEKGSAGEVAMEIIELKGISSEEGVAEIIISIEEELVKMKTDGLVTEIKEHRQKKRYMIL